MRKFIFPRAVKTASSLRTAERSLSLEEYTITGSNLPVVNVLPMTIIVWHMHWIHLFKTTNELCTLIVQYAFNLVSIFWRKLMYPRCMIYALHPTNACCTYVSLLPSFVFYYFLPTIDLLLLLNACVISIVYLVR